MTDEQIRLYAIARAAFPPLLRVRTIHDKKVIGDVYSVVTIEPSGRERYFAVPAFCLRGSYPEAVVGAELQRAARRPG